MIRGTRWIVEILDELIELVLVMQRQRDRQAQGLRGRKVAEVARGPVLRGLAHVMRPHGLRLTDAQSQRKACRDREPKSPQFTHDFSPFLLGCVSSDSFLLLERNHDCCTPELRAPSLRLFSVARVGGHHRRVQHLWFRSNQALRRFRRRGGIWIGALDTKRDAKTRGQCRVPADARPECLVIFSRPVRHCLHKSALWAPSF